MKIPKQIFIAIKYPLLLTHVRVKGKLLSYENLNQGNLSVNTF